MIPEFNETGLLPDGVHWAPLEEIEDRFVWNSHRERLFSGFDRAAEVFRAAGCRLLYLDGSFVTSKEYPGDYDACWDDTGVTLALLDPVLLDFSPGRVAQKAKYFGEFFPANSRAEARSPFRKFLDFFQIDKLTGDRKGIIGINL